MPGSGNEIRIDQKNYRLDTVMEKTGAFVVYSGVELIGGKSGKSEWIHFRL